MWLLSILLNLVNISEITIIKNGFIISEGCNEKPNNLIHLLAPLFWEPTINTTISNNINATKQIYEMSITFFSLRVEQKIIIDKPKKEKIKFLIINKLELIPILLATIGLANAVKTLPKHKVIRIKNNITLSMDNHHLPKIFIFVLSNTN